MIEVEVVAATGKRLTNWYLLALAYFLAYAAAGGGGGLNWDSCCSANIDAFSYEQDTILLEKKRKISIICANSWPEFISTVHDIWLCVYVYVSANISWLPLPPHTKIHRLSSYRVGVPLITITSVRLILTILSKSPNLGMTSSMDVPILTIADKEIKIPQTEKMEKERRANSF